MLRSREEIAYQAAQMYYIQADTMEAIARKLKVSRSTVSRLIQMARDAGYVQFTLHPPLGEPTGLRGEISQLFGLNVHVVSVPARISAKRRLDMVAAVAGYVISEAVEVNTVIGIAWGNTLAAISENLVPRTVAGVRVVQLNGAANMATSGIRYAGGILEAFGRAYNARVQHFPVPAFFDYADTKTALWRERSIRAVLDLQKETDLAVFGVGTVEGEHLSQVYSAGYLDPTEMVQIHQDGVVGDVCTVLLREDGSWEDLRINERASGPNPTDLAAIPRRVCVVAGIDKARPLLAALRAGVATDLVVDEDCGSRLMELARG